MSNLIRCDQCRVEAKEHSALDWLLLEHFGIDGRTQGSWMRTLPLHFCTGTCLRTFLKARADEAR